METVTHERLIIQTLFNFPKKAINRNNPTPPFREDIVTVLPVIMERSLVHLQSHLEIYSGSYFEKV